MTRLVAQGVDEGWVELEFPDDPLEENPVYQLKFGDPDRFATGVERLFPEVDWDEQIEVPAPEGSSEGLMPDVTSSIATEEGCRARRRSDRPSRRRAGVAAASRSAPVSREARRLAPRLSPVRRLLPETRRPSAWR